MIRLRRLRSRQNRSDLLFYSLLLALAKLAADRSALGKGDGDGFFVFAEFGGKPAYKVDHHGSAAVGEFHVHPIGTWLWCDHLASLSEGLNSKL